MRGRRSSSRRRSPRPASTCCASGFDVEVGTDWPDGELESRIGEFDAILIRSATKMTAGADRRGRRTCGRSAAPAPASTTSTSRPPPSAASSSPTRPSRTRSPPPSTRSRWRWRCSATSRRRTRRSPQGEWARSRFGGNELYGKTLGVIGFGRIGQLVARRALAFDMEVVAFDKFVSAERFRELGVEGVDIDELYARADLITIHLPKTPETIDWIDAEALAKMKDGVRIVNCARGELIDLEALEAALDSGKVAGAALDVFPSEPMTEHPLFGRDDVVVTPHLGRLDGRGAGPRRDRHRRAGLGGADRRRRHQRRQHHRGPPGDDGGAGAVRPALREARAPRPGPRQRLGRPGRGRGPRPARRARHPPARDLDPRRDPLRATPRSRSTSSTRRPSPRSAASTSSRRTDTVSPDFTELITVRIESGGETVEVAGTGVGPAQRSLPGPRLGPGLLPALRRSHRRLPLRRQAGDDRPRRLDLRRARGEHRLRRGRRRERRARGRHGADDRRAGPARGGRGDRRPRRLPPRHRPSTSRSSGSRIGLGGHARRRHHPPRGAGGARGPGAAAIPQVAPGEVRIEVRAAGINFADLLARTGMYPDAPKPPCVVGYEVAGVVESVGDGVESVAVGDRVMAATRFGGYAELCTVAGARRAPAARSGSASSRAPRSRSTTAPPTRALVLMGGLREGDRVLIHAAAGGVGHRGRPRSPRPRGAEIFGTASASKHDAIRAQGVDHAIDYRTVDFEEAVARLTGGDGDRHRLRRDRPDQLPQGLPPAAARRQARSVTASARSRPARGATSRRPQEPRER